MLFCFCTFPISSVFEEIWTSKARVLKHRRNIDFYAFVHFSRHWVNPQLYAQHHLVAQLSSFRLILKLPELLQKPASSGLLSIPTSLPGHLYNQGNPYVLHINQLASLRQNQLWQRLRHELGSGRRTARTTLEFQSERQSKRTQEIIRIGSPTARPIWTKFRPNTV